MSILSPHRDLVPGARPARWQRLVAEAIRDPAELCRLLSLPDELAAAARRAGGDFGLFVPRAFAAKMRPGDPHDPLLVQVLPVADESLRAEGFRRDPVGDRHATIAPGLLHKYHGRALLVATGACAVHCRYCFRRHFAYDQSPHGLPQWEPALAKLAADPSIAEVILSGGDPLMLVDSQLTQLAARLAVIDHLQRLRVHTRMPIVVPERVDAALLDWLTGSRLQPIVVVHANHPRELDAPVVAALARLADAGVMLFNQAVLLRGVNDNADTLVELCERLLAARVVPYYLHQLDRVAGAAHFEVPPADGQRLVDELRARLPGYAMPRFVREVAGAPFKQPLA